MAQYRSKYDPDLLEKTDRLVRQADSYSHGIEAVFDSLERAPWWSEVTDPYEVIPAGCPVREEYESADVFREFEISCTESVCEFSETPAGYRKRSISTNSRLFIDTRWTPPPTPLAVGDVIETEEQAESLPVGTIAVTMANEPIRKVSMNEWRLVNTGRSQLVLDYMMADEDDRIIYLPSGGSDD